MKKQNEKWVAIGGALLLPAIVVVVLTAYSINVLSDYGYVLFVLVPVGAGVLSSTIYGFFQVRTWKQSLKISFTTLLLACVLLLVFYIEGLGCIIMASPLLVVFQLIGTLIGHALQKRRKQPTGKLFFLNLLILPMLMHLEGTVVERSGQLIKVSTSIEIDAPIENVWETVVAFPDIPEPTDWFFKTGIAYPISSRIVGEGEEAVRYCQFTTGAFVEPITQWQEPTLLQFSVEEMPVPFDRMVTNAVPGNMYKYFVSTKGEFRLVEQGGTTTLVGSTWYYHKIRPMQYWKVWSDFIIHKIHYRVLNHIKKQAEAG